MPFTVADAHKRKKDLTGPQARRWAAVANSVLKRCVAAGGTDEKCAPRAIRQASGVLAKESENDMEFLEGAKIKLGDGSKVAISELVEFYQAHREGTEFIEDAKSDKAARSKRYGISVVQGKPVTKPGKFSALPDGQWGDPVNYAYPIPDAPRARSAIARFNAATARTDGGYSESDWNKVGRRLMRLVGGKLDATYEFTGGKLKRKQSESECESGLKKLSEIWVRGSGITSFADLAAAEEAEESAYRIQDLTRDYNDMVWNVMRSPLEEDKPGAIRGLTDEFIALLEEEMGESAARNDEPAASLHGTVSGGTLETQFSEDAAGTIIDVFESESNGISRRSPLSMDIALIQPGFGNKKDNHFYPADMLRRDAPVFEGVKMYVTDHRPGEKSVRTEVSRVKKITRYADGIPNVADGTPIASVSVFEPNFAEMVRNRADAGDLDSLECSILASGRAKKTKIDGKPAKVVESITQADSVDWVTRAGAGGRALSISENEEANMTDQKEKEKDPKKVKESEPVNISEQETPAESDKDEAPEPAPNAQTTETEPTGQEGPTLLSEQQVEQLVGDRLPKEAAELLAERDFEDAAQVEEAVVKWQKTIKALTGSGAPRGQGRSEQQGHDAEPMTEADWTARLDQIDRAHGLDVPVRAEG